jgi:hypothetical protein
MNNNIIILLFLLFGYCRTEEKISDKFQDIKCGGWQSIKCPEKFYCIQDPIKLDHYGTCKKFK